MPWLNSKAPSEVLEVLTNHTPYMSMTYLCFMMTRYIVVCKMIRLKLRHFYVKLIFKVNSHLGNFLQRMKSWIIGIIFICTRKLLIILSSKIQTLNYNTFIVTTQIPRAKGIRCLMGNTSPKLESCSSQPLRYRHNLTNSRFSFRVWYRLQHSEP